MSNNEKCGRILTLDLGAERCMQLQDALCETINEHADGMPAATVVGVLEMMQMWICTGGDEEDAD